MRTFSRIWRAGSGKYGHIFPEILATFLEGQFPICSALRAGVFEGMGGQ